MPKRETIWRKGRRLMREAKRAYYRHLLGKEYREARIERADMEELMKRKELREMMEKAELHHAFADLERSAVSCDSERLLGGLFGYGQMLAKVGAYESPYALEDVLKAWEKCKKPL